MAQLEFFFDIACPQAWLAACRIEDLARRCRAKLVLRPVLLEGIHHALNTPPRSPSELPENKRRLLDLDLQRQAELTGVTLHYPRHPVSTVDAMRLLSGAPASRRMALMHALFQTCWRDGQDPGDRDVLAGIARAHGVEPAVMDSHAAREALRQTTEEAVERGAFGVPTFMVGDQLWWGMDRMHFLEKALDGQPPAAEASPPATPATLEVFHDFSSPFSYLGCTQVARLAREHNAELVWRPMLLGALFKAIGTPMIPMAAMTGERRAWGRQDLHAWADYHDVPFRFTSHFPLYTVLALRVSVVQPALIPALYRAAWADNRNLSDADVVADVIREAGHEPGPILEQAVDQAVKDTVRRNTEEAQALGACGAPTFLVNGRLLFWGQDRLDMVAMALDGWVPQVDQERPSDSPAA